MAPEIISKKSYFGAPVDIWAIGIILYCLLVGNFPFKGASESEIFSKIKGGAINMPDTLSYKAKKLISKILCGDSSKRPTANDLYYEEWVHGKAGCSRKLKLSDEPKPQLAHFVSADNPTRLVLKQQQKW